MTTRYLWVHKKALEDIVGDNGPPFMNPIDLDYFHYGTREELEAVVNRPDAWVRFQEVEK